MKRFLRTAWNGLALASALLCLAAIGIAVLSFWREDVFVVTHNTWTFASGTRAQTNALPTQITTLHDGIFWNRGSFMIGLNRQVWSKPPLPTTLPVSDWMQKMAPEYPQGTYWRQIHRSPRQNLLADFLRYPNVIVRFAGFVVVQRPSSGETVIRIPLWILSALFAVIPLVWVRRRRARQQDEEKRCLNCGYDLRATPERCPECGAIPKSDAKGTT